MREIDIDRAAAVHAEGGAFVDVREPQEFREGHVPGAVNLPMGRLTSRLDELDRTQPVHVVCASGNRSSAMTDVLSAAGFDAVNVAGGTSAWIRAGHPIEK
ncbi:rhodanese-like domain-containing protein [Nocardioides sp. Y6]|uniref:Rhodanese-like domain-containing protein n=1 Tax=Nocardioides malaquae TaxID=2773426 RepID=A0ABR9RPS2_9ACTN|nr:rhodanese-like domain-containing protein [Nocardioides malaquae]MBE7323551.1 rhodanese-like domain-containing protein [Nocardioides malaquae]